MNPDHLEGAFVEAADVTFPQATAIFPRTTLSAQDIPTFLESAAWEVFPPTAWRRIVRYSERRMAQAILLEAAQRAERSATAQQTLQLYRAAEAVVPLHGPGLVQLIRLTLTVLPRPLPLDLVPPLLRYMRRDPRTHYGEDRSGTVIQAINEALDAAEDHLPPTGQPAAQAQIAFWRRLIAVPR